jgi:hypothetical protein
MRGRINVAKCQIVGKTFHPFDSFSQCGMTETLTLPFPSTLTSVNHRGDQDCLARNNDALPEHQPAQRKKSVAYFHTRPIAVAAQLHISVQVPRL